MKIDNCRSCGEPIVWTVTKNGKKMPVDAEASSEGTFALEDDGRNVAAVFHPKGSAPDLHESHFGTCPDRDGWRKR